VGTLVSGVTYRHPVLLAKMVVTLDHVTGGRAVLGVGAAWHEREHQMFGLGFPAVGERVGRLEETIRVFRLLCSEEETDFEGRYYRLVGARFEPKPLQPGGIPVLVGGSGQRVKRIAARHGDIFNSFPPPWEWPAVNDDLDQQARAVGRDPADIVRSAFVFSELSGDADRERDLIAHFQRTRGGTEEEVRGRVLLGSPDDMIQVIKAYEQAGISLIAVNVRPPYSSRGIERFARNVLPAFAE
jgi:alkanesulfonate monooxygenase SsuD/methylene tetrahydromethanopterin reductase-like flavin-dependent oxidoreductase (luciferase family)